MLIFVVVLIEDNRKCSQNGFLPQQPLLWYVLLVTDTVGAKGLMKTATLHWGTGLERIQVTQKSLN